MNLKFLLNRKNELVAECKALIAKTEEEERSLTEEEKEAYKAKKGELDEVKSQIDLLQGFNEEVEPVAAQASVQKTSLAAASKVTPSSIPAPEAKEEF